jgi:hypothetical protein
VDNFPFARAYLPPKSGDVALQFITNPSDFGRRRTIINGLPRPIPDAAAIEESASEGDVVGARTVVTLYVVE